MKLKIKIKLLDERCMPESKGDWIDIKSAEHVLFKRPFAHILRKSRNNGEDQSLRDIELDKQHVRCGFIMEMPKGYEALIAPRSSSDNMSNNRTFGVTFMNKPAVIDQKYCGPSDEICLNLYGLTDGEIEIGDRIAQMRFQLSQYATVWQKLKWLFTSGVEFVPVETMNHPDRHGFGHSGRN